MKVVTPGRPQRGWAKQFICTGIGNGGGGCDAVLLVEQGDVFQTHRYDYAGEHTTYNTFRCPSCKTLTDIKDGLPFTPRQKETDPVPALPGETD